MPVARVIQTNFTSGELSPRMRGRVDLAQYASGADTLTNAIVLTTGGATRRPGSYYLGNVKTAASRVRLVPFIVSNLTAYMLEFGNLYVRFYHNRLQLTDAGATPLELPTPWVLAELRDLSFSQSADVLYVCHASHQPRKISRTAAAAFQIDVVTFLNGPYDTENTGDAGTTTTPAATGAEAGSTAAAPAGSGTGYGGDQAGLNGGGSDGGGGDGGGGEGGGGEGGDGE